MRISDWSSDVCSSDLLQAAEATLMGWVWLIVIGAAAAGALALLGVGRGLWSLVGAALMLGATGYALQGRPDEPGRSEEHTSELQSLMRISYAVFCLKKKKRHNDYNNMNEKENYYEESERK